MLPKPPTYLYISFLYYIQFFKASEIIFFKGIIKFKLIIFWAISISVTKRVYHHN